MMRATRVWVATCPATILLQYAARWAWPVVVTASAQTDAHCVSQRLKTRKPTVGSRIAATIEASPTVSVVQFNTPVPHGAANACGGKNAATVRKTTAKSLLR